MSINRLESFIDSYKCRLIEKIDSIDGDVICCVVEELIRVSKNKGRVFVLGNGGSAATASHMANDFGIGLKRRGLLCLDIIALNDSIPTVSAISNDIGYSSIFRAQIEGIITSDDVVLAISCSGNSDNIIKAVDYSRNIGATIISLTGFDGGKLKHLSDINYHVNTEKGQYGVVEDLHMIFDHLIYTYFIESDISE